jgi:GxxExxY protein
VVGRHQFDLLVHEAVIVELKAGRCILPIHLAQLTSYLRASVYEVGLILNFGTVELQSRVLRRP